jgi:MYXO-CTERM domain-containing protein
VRILIALSLLAGIIVPASSALAAGSNGIGILLADVSVRSLDDPMVRSYIVGRLAPGAGVNRRVEIVNSTASPADVTVYAAAAGVRRGTFGFAPGHSRNELSSWTSVSRDVLHLPPGTSAFETVTIDVPQDASSGDRYAVIWAEVSRRAPPAGGVTLVNRVGIRMYLSIGPGGAPPANFAIGSVSAERSETGAPLVVAIVHNTGRRTLGISGTLTLAKGPGGLRAGPFPVVLDSALAPGDSESATVRLDKRLPRGPWQAHVRLRSGLIQRVAVATISFPRLAVAAKPSAPKVVPAGHGRWIVVVTILGLLAAVALALLFFWRRRGRSDLGIALAGH